MRQLVVARNERRAARRAGAARRRGRDRAPARRFHRIGTDGQRAEENLYEVEELLVQPGTYFNPQTEVLVVVDDSASLDQEVFNMEAYEGADWVRISDEVPVDEDGRDRVLESFQTSYHPGSPARLRDRARTGRRRPRRRRGAAEDPGREDEE